VDFETLQAFAGRHPLLSLALLGLTVAIVYNEFSQLFRGFKGLRPAELTALMNRDDALVVDLRPMADFEKGHIPGSKNVQVSQFDPEHKQLAAAKALPVVAVCKSGHSSAAAAKRLKKAGFERVYVLEDNTSAQQQADLPLAKDRS
jgi:rhodanese-related sulfurtransferase